MGTADYCIIVAAVFFFLLVRAIRQEEMRRGERRTAGLPPPQGIERRRVKDRRQPLSAAQVAWLGRALKARLRKWF